MFRNIHIGTDTTIPAYATFDPSMHGGNIVLSGGNLIFSCPIGTGQALATIPISDHQYYEYVVVTAIGNTVIGVADSSTNLNGYTGNDIHAWGYYWGGDVIHAGSYITNGAAPYMNGDVIGVAYTTGSVQFYKNGVSTGSAISVSGTVYPAVGCGGGAETGTANFGQNTWTFPPPVGFTGVI